MKPLDGTGLKRLHRGWRAHMSRRLTLVLDNVQSPYNVGSIVRTAAAYRVERIWVTGATPRLGDSKVAKTALGCDRYIDEQHCESPLDAIAQARAERYAVIALELAEGAIPLHELDAAGDICVVVGHEDRGIGPATLDACDAVAYAPLLGKVGSLNVATATAIGLYELRRRELAK